MSDGLSLATVWETVADTAPESVALVHGDRRRRWDEFEQRSARLAQWLENGGLHASDKVACYLYNGMEYLETTFAAFKAQAVPFNVNYRYLEAELAYLLDNADARAVVFDATFADRLDAVRADLPAMSLFLCVGADEEHPVPDWATDYEDAIAGSEPAPRVERSGDDQWFLYTGGTTGMPKGVIWPHRNLLAAASASFAVADQPVPESTADVARAVEEFHRRDRVITLLPAAPLMHGTSALTALGVLSTGGTVVTLQSRSFDGDELCEAVERNRVVQLTIVGDAFARPILTALEGAAERGRPYDLSSLKVIVSSGVMWSEQAKAELMQWCNATLADTLGSSEGVGFAINVSRKGQAAPTASFTLGENTKVFTDDGREVTPGSGERGLLALTGPIPIGYYKDPAKTAETFRTYQGRVWSVPGDYSTVETDRTIRLLGRGSVSINTAGEKVYPEEVEEVLKAHPAVADANVVGVPDDKWGQAVTAVVELAPDARSGDAAAGAGPDGEIAETLIAHTKEHLAGYKCPKSVVVVDEVVRGPNGKPDYRWAMKVATRS